MRFIVPRGSSARIYGNSTRGFVLKPGIQTSEFYVVAGVIADLLGNGGITLPPTVKGILVSVLAGVYAAYRTYLKATTAPVVVAKVPVKVTPDPPTVGT